MLLIVYIFSILTSCVILIPLFNYECVYTLNIILNMCIFKADFVCSFIYNIYVHYVFPLRVNVVQETVFC